MDVAENHRSEAVHLLWNLKMIVEKEAAGRMSVIQFNKLLYDPQYRYSIFVDAHKIGNNKISLIIKHLMAIPDIENIILRKAPPETTNKTANTPEKKNLRVQAKPAVVNKTETNKPAAVKPSVVTPVVTKPAVTKPVVTKPAITKPAVIKPSATKPSTTKPAAIIAKKIPKTPITKHVVVAAPTKTKNSKIVTLRADTKQINAEADSWPSHSNSDMTSSVEVAKRSPLLHNTFILVSGIVFSLIIATLVTYFSINSYQYVSGSIIKNTYWYADTTYILTDTVFVEADAKLIIEPGTRIEGTKNSALIITRDASIYARGTAELPIVFTSSESVGNRKPGDWGGLVLLGNAILNKTDGHIEGISHKDPRGHYGGQQQDANCGMLHYVRVEYAGRVISADNELNGISLGGCGKETVISYVQVHRSLDDGISVYGGNVDLKYIYINGAGDDSIDWDLGWQGRAQFVAIHQYKDIGNNALEGDNQKRNALATPVSKPQFYNVTMIANSGSFSKHRAITLQNGSGGIFRNFIIEGQNIESIDLRGSNIDKLIENDFVLMEHSILFNIGKNGLRYFLPEIDELNDDGGFNEAVYFKSKIFVNYFGVNPHIPQTAFRQQKPDYVPEQSSLIQLQPAVIPQQEFWDESANYIGAFRPGITRNWLSDWITTDKN